MGTTSDRPAFVFVHGAWHNGATWSEVTEELSRKGYASIANDLPGAGSNASNPTSFLTRPLDPEAFATEVSPNRATQDDRNQAVIADVRQAATMGNGRVVLVGHSLGGRTISPVTEAIPDDVGAVVYLTAQLEPGDRPPPSTTPNRAMQSLFAGNFRQTNAFRMDVNTEDPEALATVREVFYNDLDDQQVATAIERLTHCDEPLGIFTVRSNITPERFGTVERHYIRCLDDRALIPADQDAMIAAVDESLGTATTVHDMNDGHSPFYSSPGALADLLIDIANGPTS